MPTMSLLHLFTGSVLVALAVGLPHPQAVTTDAAELCTTTVTSLGIDHTVTDYKNWASSVNSVQGRASAGYNIITNTYTITGACATTTAVIPPSPTGAAFLSVHIRQPERTTPPGDGVPEPTTPPGGTTPPVTDAECVAHDDHWHCPDGVPEPTTPPGGTTPPVTDAECVAHDDHWHCPDGVPEPTTPPGSTPTAIKSGQCVAHGDHWDCPAGVAQPTTPPAAATSGTPTSSNRAVFSGAAAAPNGPVSVAVGLGAGLAALFAVLL
ncbi:hypothetical protein GMDG_05924 [Pseudogymnoascus destructans 20631-21]|uniref:Uncharacterized protein n=1 Tax=Pseudogymnoascus destructans (strain ATCC MYA-4855 / 20631-21) TaxID=658429 RepID=L8FQ47_PSED2|nr:hypothetical protein GMDG_05924 [Pseudogymnoascus destructans 20631-21]